MEPLKGHISNIYIVLISNVHQKPVLFFSSMSLQSIYKKINVN